MVLRRALILLASCLLLAPGAQADDVSADDIEIPVPEGVERDPILERMRALDRIAPFEDLAPLWDKVDPDLQAGLESELVRLELDDDVRRKKLAIAFVDISDLDEPKVAAVNGDVMMYAASLPKIAVLLASLREDRHRARWSSRRREPKS